TLSTFRTPPSRSDLIVPPPHALIAMVLACDWSTGRVKPLSAAMAPAPAANAAIVETILLPCMVVSVPRSDRVAAAGQRIGVESTRRERIQALVWVLFPRLSGFCRWWGSRREIAARSVPPAVNILMSNIFSGGAARRAAALLTPHRPRVHPFVLAHLAALAIQLRHVLGLVAQSAKELLRVAHREQGR